MSNKTTPFQPRYKAYVWYVVAAIIIFSAVQKISGQDIWLFISAATAVCAYLYFTSSSGSFSRFSFSRFKDPNIICLALFCLLFIQTILQSSMVVRSLMIFVSLLSSYYFYRVLSTLNCRKLDEGFNPLSAIYVTLGIIAIVHTLLLIASYGANPIRVTGLFQDYGQASLVILCVFALLYPSIKNKPIGIAITLIFFIAFFTPASRTVNFLLLIFLFLLFLHEKRQHNLVSYFKSLIVICISLTCVLIYPQLIVNEVVITGHTNGIEHYTSLAQYKTLNTRTDMWQSAWNAINTKPLLGYGLGNYEWTGIKDIFPLTVVSQVHNDYLQVWLELGFFWFILFVGFILYVLIVKCPIHLNYKNERFLKAKNYTDAHYMAWCLFVCLSLYMTMNFIIGSHFFQLIFVIVLVQLFSDEQNQTN